MRRITDNMRKLAPMASSALQTLAKPAAKVNNALTTNVSELGRRRPPPPRWERTPYTRDRRMYADDAGIRDAERRDNTEAAYARATLMASAGVPLVASTWYLTNKLKETDNFRRMLDDRTNAYAKYLESRRR